LKKERNKEEQEKIAPLAARFTSQHQHNAMHGPLTVAWTRVSPLEGTVMLVEANAIAYNRIQSLKY